MPEIPELEAIRAFFNDHIRGKAVGSIETRIPFVFRTPAKDLRDSLPDDRFGEVRRHGKFLLFGLLSDRVLAINPMLTGRFQYLEPKTRMNAKTCLVADVVEGKQLRYADDRLMGKIYLVPADSLSLIPNWATNGPDLLDPELTAEVWLARLKKYRGQIKSIITNAEFVQGVGNAYSDEILWEAKIHPYTPKTKLDEAALVSLRETALAVMAWATPLARDAMVKDDTVSFEIEREFNGNKMVSKYSGKLSADAITGTVLAPGRGGAEPMPREWIAKKAAMEMKK